VFPLASGAGQNFSTLTTPDAEFITDVKISTDVGLTDVRQIRLDEVVRLDEVAAVPGPVVGGGLPGLLLACGSVVLLACRRRRRVASA